MGTAAIVAAGADVFTPDDTPLGWSATSPLQKSPTFRLGIRSANVWLGLAGLVAIAWYLHRKTARGRR